MAGMVSAYWTQDRPHHLPPRLLRRLRRRSSCAGRGDRTPVRGDPDHPVSRGKLCRKCTLGYNGAFLDPAARLTTPLRRVGAEGHRAFEAICGTRRWRSSPSACGAIAASLGPEAILNAHYTGTFSLLGYVFALRFFNRLGATEVDPDTICNHAGHVALDYLYGDLVDGFDPRTARDAACILVWGANPSASAPHAARALAAGGAGHDHRGRPDPHRDGAEPPTCTCSRSPAPTRRSPSRCCTSLARDGLVDGAFLADHTLGCDELEPPSPRARPRGASADRRAGRD